MKNRPTTPSAPYDRDAALRRLNGELGLFRELVGFYVEDSRLYLEEARSHLSAGRGSEFGRVMHRIKGLAANFEADPLFAAAAAGEQAGLASNLDEAALVFSRVECEVFRLMTALENDDRPPDP